MSSTRRLTVWLLIFSFSFMGCYSSELINPNVVQTYHVNSIEAVVKKDRTRITFDTPPRVLNNAFVMGRGTDEHDTICADEISYVITSDGKKHLCDPSPAMAADVIQIYQAGEVKEKIHSCPQAIDFVITEDGRKYLFEDPPEIVRDTIFGEVKAQGIAAIPLSDVTTVSVTELDVGATVTVVAGTVVLIGGIAALVAIGMGSLDFTTFGH
jgi:hypothetical protein